MTSNKTPVVKNTDNQIGKIPVAKIQKTTKRKTNIQSNKVSADTNEELSLSNSVQILLRTYGIERSHGSIRDLADISDGIFDFKDAVSALQNLEFDSNVGVLTPSQITSGHCPLIIELKDRSKAVLVKVERKKNLSFMTKV